MGVELGRISGPLLAENLLRHGAPLAFETDLLYLFVDGTGRIGINTISPGRELDVVGTTSFNNGAATGSDVHVTSSAKFTNLNFVDNRIQALSGNDIYFTPDQTTDPVIVANEIQTASLQLVNSAITSLVSNSNINFAANGTGKVTFNTTQLNVNADLHATGNITWDGNVIIGNPGQDDNVTFRAEVASDLIPDINQEYDLGSLVKRWNTLYSTNLQADDLILESSIINGIDLLTTPGNTIFVSTTGNNTNTGLHKHSTFLTIKHALSVATVGDSILIFPGTYQEIFPLTVPAGVSVLGNSIRSVTISPTTSTATNDAFLLNGESTVSNLTISGTAYNSLTNTGYAFRFANNFKVTTRSPYVQNVSVISATADYSLGAGAEQFIGTVKSVGNYIFYVKNTPTVRIEIYDVVNKTLVGFINTPHSINSISSFDVDSTYLIIGCTPRFFGGPVNQGAAYVYNWSSGTLVRTFLDPRGIPSSSTFSYGFSVAISGDRCTVSDRGFTLSGFTEEGRVYVYQISTGSTLYTIDSPLIPRATNPSSRAGRFGTTLDMSATYLAIKHENPQYYSGSYPSHGRVYLYNLTTGLLHKTLNNTLSTYYQDGGPNFGASISIDQTVDKIAIGVPRFGDLFDNRTNSGGVCIFTLSGGTTFSISTIRDPNIEGYPRQDEFGISLELKGNRLIVGAYGESPQGSTSTAYGTYSGAAYVYDVSTNWNDNPPGSALLKTFYNPNTYSTETNDYFGISVTMTDSAYIVLASGEDTPTLFQAGVIYVYPKTVTAGRGALVDGSAANSTSVQASMLFHAVTFIVPGADGITVTNGARVEWLNSFTYYANRGIYLIRGTLGFASQGVVFGAEMRSINSANVYGTFGAVADGANTLAYLIGHNFAYIGSGSDNFNDDGLTLQANEVVELNAGKIYYDSMDHKGNFRVGNILLVNQQTGQVTFDAQSINFGPSGNITLDGPGSQTIIDATKIQVGNIRIHDNNIDSLSGPVNFYAFSGITTLNTDVFVTGNVNVSNNVTVKGNVFLGDTQFDLINIYPNITQNINPATTNTYTLGVKGLDPKVWNTAFLTTLDIDGVTQLTNNTISTLTTNTDLELISAGDGLLRVTGTDVQLDQQLTVGGTITVNGTTSLKNVEIGTILSPKTVTLTGNIGQTGDTYITGLFDNNNISVTGVGSYLQVPNINILDNVISTTTSDLDLTFTANGTGGVVFGNKLKIVDNVISNIWVGASNNTKKSILFTPDGTGSLVINATSALTVPYGNNTARVLGVNGEIRQNSLDGEYEGFNNTGNESLTKFHSADKKTFITPELALGTNDNIIRMYVNNTLKATIDVDKMASNVLQVGNFVLSGNTINNPVTGSDTIIQPSGTGSIDANGLLFKDSSITNTLSTPIVLASTGIGYIKFTGTGAVVFPYGNTSDRRLTPELGETRYNYQLNYMEVFNGTSWIPATGTSGAAPLNEVLDIMDLWSLVLG